MALSKATVYIVDHQDILGPRQKMRKKPVQIWWCYLVLQCIIYIYVYIGKYINIYSKIVRILQPNLRKTTNTIIVCQRLKDSTDSTSIINQAVERDFVGDLLRQTKNIRYNKINQSYFSILFPKLSMKSVNEL